MAVQGATSTQNLQTASQIVEDDVQNPKNPLDQANKSSSMPQSQYNADEEIRNSDVKIHLQMYVQGATSTQNLQIASQIIEDDIKNPKNPSN